MRSELQLHRQCLERCSDTSQSREIQGVRSPLRRGPRLGDGSRQICCRLGASLRHLRPGHVERPFGKRPLFRILDRATQLTSCKEERADLNAARTYYASQCRSRLAELVAVSIIEPTSGI